MFQVFTSEIALPIASLVQPPLTQTSDPPGSDTSEGLQAATQLFAPSTPYFGFHRGYDPLVTL